MINTGLAEVAEQIKKAGGKCWTYYCDIGDKEAVYHTAKAVQIEIGNVSKCCLNYGRDTIKNRQPWANF